MLRFWLQVEAKIINGNNNKKETTKKKEKKKQQQKQETKWRKQLISLWITLNRISYVTKTNINIYVF